MSILRTINHPGIEVREIDKSQLSPSPVGTYFYLPGFTDKGEEYQPQIMASMSDYTSIYGTPTNEAEKYHYYATREVIRNNGTAVCAKLPYANDLSKGYKKTEIGFAGTVDISGFTTLSGISAGAYGFESVTPMSIGSVSDISNSDYDMLKTGAFPAGLNNEFVIVNEIKSTFGGPEENEGIFVVLVDPFDAMNVQRMLPNPKETDVMNVLSSIKGDDVIPEDDYDRPLFGAFKDDSVSEDIMRHFPNIDYLENGNNINAEYSQYIGLVVCKTYYNQNSGEKVSVGIVEAFTGSIFPGKTNKATGLTEYIGDHINNHSKLIKFFRNPNLSSLDTINESESTILMRAATVGDYSLMGWPKKDAVKVIDGGSLAQELEKALTKIDNLNDIQIDVVVDAGISTIAQFTSETKEFHPQLGEFDTNDITSAESLMIWRNIVSTLEQFCSKIRKDCMCILDAPRHLVLDGQEKYVRKTSPDNTFSNTIGNKLRYITGINSSYAALYADWFAINDEFTGTPLWIPETVKVAGVYGYSDSVANMWDAPAGLNRGVVNGVYDVAFNPNGKEMDQLYTKSINYAVKYPLDGFIVEGQKTTQAKPSAFDRVNVRRLFLRLERAVRGVARYFVYEPNNLFVRRRLLDVITPMFAAVKAGGGLYEYRLICDESNNTPDVIDNNELKIAVILKPVRTAEFILIDFVATRTDANFDEIVQEI